MIGSVELESYQKRTLPPISVTNKLLNTTKIEKMSNFRNLFCMVAMFNLYLFVVYVVFPIYLNQIVNNRSSGVYHSEKMRPIKYFIWLLWLFAVNAELTLESVNRKVNDLEVEVTALKVLHIKCNQ